MKNIKFGVFCLGLAVAIVTAVSSLNAQPRAQVPRPELMVLDGRGSELGAMVSDVPSTRQPSQANADSLRAGDQQLSGVRIDQVHADSPAEQAGLRAGDIVVDYDGERVRSARQFTRLVQETPEGRSVAIGIMRDGKKQTVTATPEAERMTWNFGPDVDRALREAERGMRGFRFDLPPQYFDFRFDDRDRDNREPRRFEYRVPEEFRFPSSRGRLGVSVQSITPELAEFFGAKNGGALVSSVSRDSAAAKAGVKAGDVIVSINGTAVSDTGDLMDALEDITGEATIVVLRDKKEMTLKATLSSRSGV